MTGSGNDFVMVDARLSRPEQWTPADFRAVCARGTGVGADGVVFVGPGSVAGAARMIYYNSDGSHAAMCGNAALCSTRLAARLGLADHRGMQLETDAGVYESRCPADGDRAELRLASVEPPKPVRGLTSTAGERRTALGTVGVPHLIVLVDDVDAVDLLARGAALRRDPSLGPDGANVNFVSCAKGARDWHMRTFERGIEAETLACGTGAVAAALALQEWGLAVVPIVILTRSGRKLAVRARRDSAGIYQDVWLEGEARVVLRGVLS